MYEFHKKNSDLHFCLTICPPEDIDDDAIFDNEVIEKANFEVIVQDQKLINNFKKKHTLCLNELKLNEAKT